MTNKKPDTHDILLWISRCSADADWSPEETYEALKEAGVDTASVQKRLMAQVKTSLDRSPLNWRNRANAKRLDILKEINSADWPDISKLTRSELLGSITQALARLPDAAKAQYAFHKFEEAPDDDLRSMLEELRIIERVDRNNEG